MGKNSRSRIIFNRKRLYVRKYITIRNIIFLISFIILAISCIIIVCNLILINKANKYTKKYREEKNIEIDIYNNNQKNEVNIENDDTSVSSNGNKNNVAFESELVKNDVEDLSKMSVSILGEINMGGNITKNLNYIYSAAFKDIYFYTKDSDFTYTTLGTNITNEEKINTDKNKNLVTKEIINGLSALGVDCVNIATEHIIDYSKEGVSLTESILDKYKFLVAGKANIPVYFEKGNQKIAVVSTNSITNSNKYKYTESEISLYDEKELKKNIKEAKKIADIVIVDFHYGNEYEYGVTNSMTSMAYKAIDSGADLVIGSHALGVYPIIKYKGKPIIFSTGYFMGDTDMYVGNQSFIFNLNIENKKINSIEMIPIYIDNKKQVLLYSEFNINKRNEILKMYNNWQLENGLNSKVEDNKIIVEL